LARGDGFRLDGTTDLRRGSGRHYAVHWREKACNAWWDLSQPDIRELALNREGRPASAGCCSQRVVYNETRTLEALEIIDFRANQILIRKRVDQ